MYSVCLLRILDTSSLRTVGHVINEKKNCRELGKTGEELTTYFSTDIVRINSRSKFPNAIDLCFEGRFKYLN